jgi:hypothetical protein
VEEVALWAKAMRVDNNRQLELLKQMVFIKPKDLFAYQDMLLSFSKSKSQSLENEYCLLTY